VEFHSLCLPAKLPENQIKYEVYSVVSSEVVYASSLFREIYIKA
jgi:hypothetical protein